MKLPLTPLLLAAAVAGTALTIAQQQRPKGAPEGRRPGDLRAHVNLRVGDAAPDFKLKTKEGDREIQLSSFKGRKPVVLVFGSYT